MARIRVKIPRNADQLVTLLKAIRDKHIADGVNSKLTDLLDPDTAAGIGEADTKLQELKQLRRDAEQKTEELQLLLGIRKGQRLSDRNSLRFVAASARDVLLGIYKGQERKLGDHGFEVDDTAPGGSEQPGGEVPSPGV